MVLLFIRNAMAIRKTSMSAMYLACRLLALIQPHGWNSVSFTANQVSGARYALTYHRCAVVPRVTAPSSELCGLKWGSRFVVSGLWDYDGDHGPLRCQWACHWLPICWSPASSVVFGWRCGQPLDRFECHFCPCLTSAAGAGHSYASVSKKRSTVASYI